MGNKHGKEGDFDPELDNTGHGQREGLSSWYRQGVEVTDVYDILGVLGSGLMGEVYRVRRKKEERGMHNSITRKASKPDLDKADDTEEKKAGAIGMKKATKMMRKSIRKMDISKAKDKDGKKDKDKDKDESILSVPDEPLPKTPPSPKTPKPQGILRKASRGQHAKASSDDADDDACSDAGSVSSAQSDSTALSASGRKNKKAAAKRKIRFAREYACKTVSTSRVKTGQLQEMVNEIHAMRTLDHPYILRLYEVYQVKRKLWLITELCSGGDLTSRKINEPKVTVVLEQILRAVAYIHRRGVMHRDLKLENIMYENGNHDARIRLIDFGLSQTFDRGVEGRKVIASAYTLSPEIASGEGEYTEKTEVWSIGIIAWILLAGDFPFLKEEKDLKEKEKLDRLLKAKYTFGITWSGRGISDNAKEFVKRCLKLNPDSRWTVKDALEFLQNTWIPALEERATEYEDKESKRTLEKSTSARQRLHSADMDKVGIEVGDIESFCRAGLLKKTILTTMAHTMDRNDVVHLREIFLTADTEDTGTISLLELKGALSNLDTQIDDETVERMFKGIDQDKSGQIHYAEFLAALAESQGLVTMERLGEAFDRIDSDGKGYISHDDLKAVLGRDYNEELVNRMIEEADFKKNGQVDYDEFLRLMFDDDLKAGHDAAGDIASSLNNMDGFGDITDSLRSTDSIKALTEDVQSKA